MFEITMLPAEFGDCLWLEYGENQDRPHRVLIDGGTPGSYGALANAVEELPEGSRSFELFVITHIDSDHIGGALKLLKKRSELGVEFSDIWFNGYTHLEPDSDVLGPVQGEKLTKEIVLQNLPWNRAFEGRTVVVVPEGELPSKTLDGGMKLTLLSPTWDELNRLRPKWEEVVTKAGLKPGFGAEEAEEELEDDILGGLDVEKLASRPFKSDRTEANASSIVLLAEYQGVRILLAGDGQVPVLSKTVPRLSSADREIKWFKLPHHGSRANVSSELLSSLPCKRFLLSSNGKNYHHPDKEAVARVIKAGEGTALYFNYRTEYNEEWDDSSLKRSHRYSTTYPGRGSQGLRIDLDR